MKYKSGRPRRRLSANTVASVTLKKRKRRRLQLDPDKSHNHVCFKDGWEYYLSQNGLVLCKADVNNPLDDDGYRSNAMWVANGVNVVAEVVRQVAGRHPEALGLGIWTQARDERDRRIRAMVGEGRALAAYDPNEIVKPKQRRRLKRRRRRLRS